MEPDINEEKKDLADTEAKQAKITSIIAHKKGFIVGSTNGYLGIYEIERDFSVNHIDTFKIDPLCTAIQSLSISFDRSFMVAAALIHESSGQVVSGFGRTEEEIPDIDRIELFQMNLHQMSVLKNVFTLPTKPVFPHGNPYS